jgi:hypothetical protein
MHDKPDQVYWTSRAIIASMPPGYVVYPGLPQPVHAPGCYWASQPRTVGYTGTADAQVCPGYTPALRLRYSKRRVGFSTWARSTRASSSSRLAGIESEVWNLSRNPRPTPSRIALRNRTSSGHICTIGTPGPNRHPDCLVKAQRSTAGRRAVPERPSRNVRFADYHRFAVCAV